MKLVKLISYDSMDLVHCSLCKDARPWKLAAEEGWVLDIDDDNKYYCLECKSFLVNKLDDGKNVC